MSKVGGESVNHLLLHCPVALELWDLVLALFGVAWVMPKGVEELLCCWAGRFGKSRAGAIWKIIPHCLMWCIWCERNARTFSGEEQTTPALKLSFLRTLFEWVAASNLADSSSLPEMLDICSFST